MSDRNPLTTRSATKIDIRDLAGTSKVLEGRDLSKARLEGQLRDHHLVDIRFTKCDFDRSISCRDVIFERCVFSRAKLGGSFTDCNFEDCDFSESAFKGSHNEYGFTRCRFTNCSFEGSSWRRPYFKTVEFHDCSFENAECIEAFMSGFKTYGTHPAPSFFNNAEIRSIFRDGEKLACE